MHYRIVFTAVLAGLGAAIPTNLGPAASLNERTINPDSIAVTAASTEQINSVLTPVNQFREAKGLPPVAWSDEMYDNAFRAGYMNVVQSPDGGQMIHDLFQGTNAQVIAPGIGDQNVCSRNMEGYTPFELALSGWLCEVPSDPAIGHNCDAVGAINHLIVGGPDDGHWKIFSNADYKHIGCAYTGFTEGHSQCDTFTGFWFCDLSLS